jgi:hypothetical protein
MSWEPTTEVTAEQIFAWDKEDFAARMKLPNALPIRRGYMGLLRIVPGTICDVEAIEDAVFAQGYRVRFWRGVVPGVPEREGIAVEKEDAAERAHWGKTAPERKPGPYVCSRMRDAMKERS